MKTKIRKILGILVALILMLGVSTSPAKADSFSSLHRLRQNNTITGATYLSDGTLIMSDSYAHTYPNEMWIYGTGSTKTINAIAVNKDNSILMVSDNGRWQIIGQNISNYGSWSHGSYEITTIAARTDGSFVIAGDTRWQIVNANGILDVTGTTNFDIVTATARPDGTVILAGDCTWQVLNADNTLGAKGYSSSSYINCSTLRPDGSVFIGCDNGKYIVIDSSNRLMRAGTLTNSYDIYSVAARPDGSVFCALGSMNYQVVRNDFSLEPIGDCDVDNVYTTASSPDGVVIIGGDYGHYQYYYPSSYYTISITEQTTSAALTVKWNGNNITAGKVQYSTDNVTWYDGGNIANGTAAVTGLSKSTKYYFRVNINDYFISPAVTDYTLADVPTGLTVSTSDLSSITLSWNNNGNDPNTVYELYCNTTGKTVYTGTAATYTHTGLSSGLQYSYKVRAKNGNSIYSAYSPDYACYTAPSTPTLTVNSSGRINWSNTRGRGYVVLNWQLVTGATGYKVWVFDGNTYRSFDAGNATTWDSRTWKIYPTDAALNGYGDNTQSGNLFNTIKGGLDLADNPNTLYKKTVGTSSDSNNSYYFKITAYNSTSESPQSTAVSIMLPNSTDSTAPQISSLIINDGAANTGSKSVSLSLAAVDPKATNYTAVESDDYSGVQKIQISNDNFVSFNEFAPASSIDWQLTAGEGSKTVYVRAVDNAGNTGAATTASIYYINDITIPDVTETINNGIPYTETNLVDININAQDNLTPIEGLLYRVSIDGQSWKHYNPASKQWESEWGQYIPMSPAYNIGSQGGTIYIFIQVKDTNGNIRNKIASITYTTPETKPAVAESFKAPKVTIPELSENMNGQIVSISGENMQILQTNTVSLQMTGLVNVKKVMFSFDGINWGTPDNLPESSVSYDKGVTFNSQGKMAVYLKFINKDGYESQPIVRKYLVDYQAPEGSISCIGSDATSGSTIQLMVKYKDNISSTLRYSVNGSNYQTVPSSGLITVPLDIPGLNQINIKIIDEAGNVTSDTVTAWKLAS